jgi:hypothetical protein
MSRLVATARHSFGAGSGCSLLAFASMTDFAALQFFPNIETAGGMPLAAIFQRQPARL